MGEVYRLCSLSVCRCTAGTAGTAGTAPPPPATAAAAAAGGSVGGWPLCAYELLLQQDLRDGAYHEPEESAGTIRLQVSQRGVSLVTLAATASVCNGRQRRCRAELPGSNAPVCSVTVLPAANPRCCPAALLPC